jgi:hypothetical protein
MPSNRALAAQLAQAEGAPLGERSPVYHSCEPAGNAEAAIATIVATRTTNDRIFSNLQSASTKSCGSENLRRILLGATRRSFGSRARLGLRPARRPGLFLPSLRPGSWWPLFHLDPTSLSTGIGTGD